MVSAGTVRGVPGMVTTPLRGTCRVAHKCPGRVHKGARLQILESAHKCVKHVSEGFMSIRRATPGPALDGSICCASRPAGGQLSAEPDYVPYYLNTAVVDGDQRGSQVADLRF